MLTALAYLRLTYVGQRTTKLYVKKKKESKYVLQTPNYIVLEYNVKSNLDYVKFTCHCNQLLLQLCSVLALLCDN